MNVGKHEVEITGYTTGVNGNGTKLMEIDVASRVNPTETDRVTIYFSQGSSENIRIALDQLKKFGWHKGHPSGLDAIIGAQTSIEVYEEQWVDREGTERTTRKTRFVRSDRPSQIKSAMTKDAASKWLESLDKGPARGF